MNRNKKENRTYRSVKRVLITTSAAAAAVVAALLLAGFLMQGLPVVWESVRQEDRAGNGSFQKQESVTSDDEVPDSGSVDAGAGKSRLDTSYHPAAGQESYADVSTDRMEPDQNLHAGQTGQNQGAQPSSAESQDQAQTGQAANPKSQDVQPDQADAQETSNQTSAEKMIQEMTLEEKIAQLFILTPEALTGVQRAVKAGETTQKAVDAYPVGGLVYFQKNIESEKQFVKMVKNTQKYGKKRSGLPFFICVDEEGGSVARISGRGFLDVPEMGDMCEIGQQGDGAAAYEAGKQIGEYLSRFQVNVDFAPVADVFSNAKNTVIGKRSFGSNPDLVAKMAANEVYGLKSQNVAAVLKHFPGHGDTREDSHLGRVSVNKTLDELRGCELVPFRAGIDAGADFVMVGHISLPNILNDQTPASLSYTIVTELLREEMGFDGIVVTDALDMGAVTEHYDAAQAATQAVLAGVDMLLMPQDFKAAYQGLVEAVREGTIKETRIDESLERIFKLKKTMY
ncbi:MAG: hypothetical protein HFH35_15880 [Eubacterium sp.]|nr:hypothetical protein [Eubacterium sp.]